MKAGTPEATPRAEVGARRMRMVGLDVEAAIVGDPDPFAVVGDALQAEEFDDPGGGCSFEIPDSPQRFRKLLAVPPGNPHFGEQRPFCRPTDGDRELVGPTGPA
jgi:hypothetical protein